MAYSYCDVLAPLRNKILVATTSCTPRFVATRALGVLAQPLQADPRFLETPFQEGRVGTTGGYYAKSSRRHEQDPRASGGRRCAGAEEAPRGRRLGAVKAGADSSNSAEEARAIAQSWPCCQLPQLQGPGGEMERSLCGGRDWFGVTRFFVASCRRAMEGTMVTSFRT